MAQGRIFYIFVAIHILSWILDYFPGLFTIRRSGVKYHFAVCLTLLLF